MLCRVLHDLGPAAPKPQAAEKILEGLESILQGLRAHWARTEHQGDRLSCWSWDSWCHPVYAPILQGRKLRPCPLQPFHTGASPPGYRYTGWKTQDADLVLSRCPGMALSQAEPWALWGCPAHQPGVSALPIFGKRTWCPETGCLFPMAELPPPSLFSPAWHLPSGGCTPLLTPCCVFSVSVCLYTRTFAWVGMLRGKGLTWEQNSQGDVKPSMGNRVNTVISIYGISQAPDLVRDHLVS